MLINNAGILSSGPFESTPLARHKAMLDVNVGGVLTGCHTAFSHLKKTANSCVVNIASASAMYGQPSLATYSATKFAVRGLTEALNLEWWGHGIRVVDIWPLFVQTAMLNDIDAVSLTKAGVKLAPEDVAQVVEKAVLAGPRSKKVHWTVGREAALLKMASSVVPDRVARAVTKRIAVDD